MQYVDIEEIGRGRFGLVTKCRDGNGRVFAKKTLLSKEKRDIDRFKYEVRLMAQLDHPNIAPIIDQRLSNEPHFYIMPLYTGSLRNKIKNGGITGEREEIIKIMKDVTNGLAQSHVEKIIHRDLKPENVLFSSDNNYVICDFGISKAPEMPRDTALTSGGAQLGTDCYMSPEQFRNTRDVDIRTDIYAAGKMLIELWVGYSVPGKQGADDLPKDLRYIAEKCLEDKPEMRYQNGSELHAAFELLSETMEKSTSERIDDLILWGDVFETASDNQISEMARLFDDLDDDNLHKKLPELSTENLKRCHAIDRSSTRSFVIKYCEHACSQLWPFAHTDKLCDSLNVFLKTFDDPIIKAASIYAQYKIGASHNRYYVIREFKKNIVAVSSDIPTVMEIENLLKKKKIDSLHKSIGYVSVQEVHKTLQKLFIKSSPREF